jgi:hypothetical protein
VAGPNFNDGSVDEVPWATVFDPDVNVRALGEIQARGFRAASELVDRFVQSANKNRSDSTAASCQPPVNGNEIKREATGVDVGSVIRTWESVVGRLAGSLRGAAEPERATLDLTKTSASGSVMLAAAPGERAHGEVWLHNGGAIDLRPVRLRCSDLVGHDGGIVVAQMVRFDPDAVAMLARSSRGVLVEIDVAADLRTGTYRGTLLAEDHPDVWLPIALSVRPSTA